MKFFSMLLALASLAGCASGRQVAKYSDHWEELGRNAPPPEAGHRLIGVVEVPASSPRATHTAQITSGYRTAPAMNQTGWPAATSPEWRRANGNIGVHTASKASPAVDASGVYVGGDSSQFHAYEHDGRERWRFSVAGASRGIHATAALDEEFLYFGAYNGNLYKLRKGDGAPSWILNLGHAIGASPLLSGRFLYVGVELAQPANGFLVKIDRATGQEFWRTELLGEQLHSSPVLDPVQGHLLFGANNGQLFSVDEKTGRIRWRFSANGPIKGSPLVLGDSVFFTSWDGNVYALNTRDGSLRWQTNVGRSQSSPARIPGSEILLLGIEGAVIGLKEGTGELAWKRLAPGYKAISSGAPVILGKQGAAWIGCETRGICLFSSSGEVLARLKLEGTLTGIPVPWNNTLYFSEDAPGSLVRWNLNEPVPR